MAYRNNINAVSEDVAFERHLAYLASLKGSKSEYAKAVVASRLEATAPGRPHYGETSWNTVGGYLGSRCNWSDQF